MSLVMNRSRQVPADETPAFGGIAERFRRAGDLERAVALCRDGLKKFPDHLSARVTLGWSLLDLGRYEEAQVELEQVLKRAPDNLAAIRGLAELHERAENAVTVPIEDHEAAEAAAALEAAHALEAENAQHHAPHDPPKKVKAHHEPQPHVEAPPEPPKKVSKSTAPATSVFAEPVLAHDGKEKATPNASTAESKPAPTLEELGAQFAAEPPKAAEVAKTPPVELSSPVPVLDARGEVVPELTIAASTDLPVPDPVVDELPDLVNKLLASTMATPAEAPDVVPEVIVDVAPEPEAPLVDFTAADADALLSGAALLSSPDPEPPVAEPVPVADVEIPTAMFAAHAIAEAAEPHPQPEPAFEPASTATPDPVADLAHTSMMAAEQMATARDAHPEPDVTELIAQFAPEAETDVPAAMPSAELPAAEAHPQPDISELVSYATPDPAESAHAPQDGFESEAAWNAATPDFVAAMETAAAEPRVVPPVEPAPGEAFALSADLPTPAPLEDFGLEAESLAAVESRPDQPTLGLTDDPAIETKTPTVGAIQALNFEAPPPAPLAPVIPPAPISVPVAPAPVAPPPIATSAVVTPPKTPASTRGRAKANKSARTVAALEKMLRGIETRRGQIASEYRPS